jgi:CarD family transcriptional regulator
MKKINLKNILKKTFKKKKKVLPKKKTKPISKKSKIIKKKNKIGRPQIKKINKNSLKEKAKINLSKPKNSENLRLTKSQDQKPEIVKIKKQDTEKKQFKPKDYIVYPKHGVGQILSISSKTIGGIDVQCYDIKFEKDKAIGLLPINKQSNLRPLSTINQVNKSISILKGKPKIKRSMWSRRAQEYEQKITSGKIYELAEVVRDLNKGDDIMIDQSYSERQLFEKAYERILTEFQIILNLSLEDTQKKLDKSLKRNLEKSQQNLEKKAPANPQPSQDTEEPENLENETEEK